MPARWLPPAFGELPARVLFQPPGQSRLAGRLVVGVPQDEEEQDGVEPAVRGLPEVGEFTVPGLVDDASGLFAAEGAVAPGPGTPGRGSSTAAYPAYPCRGTNPYPAPATANTDDSADRAGPCSRDGARPWRHVGHPPRRDAEVADQA
ncbi:hypothetical protein SHO565_52680 [Streptomyces sp. HO565]